MSYSKHNTSLPESLIKEIQKYIDGDYIYIPKKAPKRQRWGTKTGTRDALKKRNQQIYQDYLKGHSSKDLAGSYFLSIKSIQRILLEEKRLMIKP